MFMTLDELYFVKPDTVIIFDEYYHAVYKHLLNINGKGQVLGIHGLRSLGGRRLLLGGVCGQQFKTDILPKLVHEPLIIDKFTSMFEMIGQSIDGGTAVTTRPKLAELRSACSDHIAKRAELLPVIVIGGEYLLSKLRH